MLKLSEKAVTASWDLMMTENQVKDFIEGPESGMNAVCVSENGHCFCHRQVGCVTIWMEYHYEGSDLLVDSIYYHRVRVQEE